MNSITYNEADMMCVSIARRIYDGNKVFHGVASPIPMVSIGLAKKLHAKNLVYVNITGGVDVTPTHYEKSTDHPVLFDKTASIFTLIDIFDLSARGELDIAFLSGVQISETGEINASVIGEYDKPKVRLPGGAGSAVLVPSVKNAYIWRAKHDKRTFVKECDFVTTKGNITYVFTPKCIFEVDDKGLKLHRIFKNSSLEDIIEHTGFEVRYDSIVFEDEPTQEELNILHEIDSENIRSIEF